MGRLATAVVAATLALVPACALVGTGPAGEVQAPMVTVGELPDGEDTVVVRIVDGDTLEVRRVGRVRLIGVDTPEVHQDECYAREATRFLASLVSPGTGVRLAYGVERHDRYGRTLAYLYRTDDRAFVNAEIVARGYGQILTIPPNVAHQEAFLDLEREARRSGRGLWGACPPGEG